MSGGARQRNKGANAESNSHAATHEGEKKSKSNKGGSSSSSSSSSSQKTSSGAVWKLFTLLFYVGLIAVCACSGWVVYNLQDELAQIGNNLRHISQQKADLAETVSALQKQAKGLENTVSRLEFISKDIQEKQQSHESSLRKSEKDLDQIGTILKKFQKEFSSDIQVVKEQRETDSIRFENTVKEKFTELNNSLNDGIKEVIEVQKTSQEEINILKDKLASLADFHSIQSELDNLKLATSELQTSVLSNGESVQWLMTNAQNLDSIIANTNEIQLLRDEHSDLKRNVDAQLAAVEELKAKLSDSSEVQTLGGKLEQLASTFSEVKNQFEATKDDLLKEFESNADSLESKLKPIEHTVNVLNSQAAVQFEGLDTLKASINEYSQRLGRAEEALVAVQQKSSGDIDATTDNLEEGLKRLSEEVSTLKSTVADLPNEFTDVEKLQSEVTSVLEAHKDELGGLKQEYDQWRRSIEENINNIGSSVQQLNADELNASVAKLEADLKMMRTAVDSLVAYSVKIETNQNELETLKDSLEVLKESTETMMGKLEQIQEAV